MRQSVDGKRAVRLAQWARYDRNVEKLGKQAAVVMMEGESVSEVGLMKQYVEKRGRG
jgi:hypothetical protein